MKKRKINDWRYPNEDTADIHNIHFEHCSISGKNIHMEKVWIKTDRKIEKGGIKCAA